MFLGDYEARNAKIIAACEGGRTFRDVAREVDLTASAVSYIYKRHKAKLASTAAAIKKSDPDKLDRSPQELPGLDVRALNCISNAGIDTVGDLVKLTEVEVLRWPNAGRSTLDALKRSLASVGLRLQENDHIVASGDDGDVKLSVSVESLRSNVWVRTVAHMDGFGPLLDEMVAEHIASPEFKDRLRGLAREELNRVAAYAVGSYFREGSGAQAAKMAAAQAILSMGGGDGDGDGSPSGLMGHAVP